MFDSWSSLWPGYERTGGDESYFHLLAVDTDCAGDRAHRDATAVKLHGLCGFLDREAVLAAHDVAPGEMLRYGRAVHTILLSQVSDAETSEVIVHKSIYFCGGEKGLRFPNPPDGRATNVVNRGAIDPLRYPVYASFPAGNQGFQLRARI